MRKLNLKRTMSENTNATPSDIVDTKQALYRLGYYRPKVGNTFGDWVDREMFDGLRAFQEDYELKVDGIMRPGGPTEAAINQQLAFSAGEQGEEDEELPGEGARPPIIVPPEVDPNMPEIRDPVPSAPAYRNEDGNWITEGVNPRWGQLIRPRKGPI